MAMSYRGLSLNTLYALFGIGEFARTPNILLINIQNAKRRSACLSAIENEFFTRTVPDEENEGEVIEECVLSWGAEPAAYSKEFEAALHSRDVAENADLRRWLTTALNELEEYWGVMGTSIGPAHWSQAARKMLKGPG